MPTYGHHPRSKRPALRRSSMRYRPIGPHRPGVRHRLGFSRPRVLAVVASLVLGASILGWAKSAGVIGDSDRYDPNTPCGSGGYVVRHILIDSSDPVSLAQEEQLAALIEDFVERSDKGDMMSVALLTHDVYSPIQVLFNACDPGGAESVNPFFETTAVVESRRQQEFVEPLQKAIESARQPTPKDFTPLIEGLQAISLYPTFRGGYDMQPLGIEMLLLSDLLQHSRVSAYRGDLYTETGDNYGERFPTYLSGADVDIGLIYRSGDDDLQDARHWNWCQKYLKRIGAGRITRHAVL